MLTSGTMNAPLPIFSLDAPGQSAPIGSIPGRGEDAFADSLNAALAATAQQDVASTAQQQAKPSRPEKGNLTGDQNEAGGALTSGGGAPSDVTPSTTGSEIGAGAELSASAAALQIHNADIAAQTARSDDAALVLQKVAISAGIDRADAEADNLLLQAGRQAQTASLDAAARQAAVASTQDLQVADETGQQSLASSELTPAVKNGHGQQAGAAPPTSSDQRMMDRAIRENGFTALSPLPSTPAAGSAADQALQMARSAGSAAAVAAAQSLVSANQSSAAAKLDLQRSAIKADGETVEVAARGVMSLSAQNPAEPVSPTDRRSAAIGQTELANRGPAIGLFTGDAGTAVDPSRTTSASPNLTQAEAVLAATKENAGKSTSATTLAGGVAGSVAAQLAAEAGQLQNADASGFDRVQPAFSADASASQIERLEPGSGLGSLRAQAQATYVPAGTQVALQIVRSVPNGLDRFSVHLQPAELGSVDIQLSFESAGRVSALITAERPETLEMLQRDSRILERSLGDSGLKLSSDGLSFGLKQDQQQQHGQGFQGQAQDRHAAIRAGRAYDETSDPVGPTPGITHVSGLRLLDIET